MPKRRKPPEPKQQSGPPPIDVVLPSYKWRGLASAIRCYAKKLIQAEQDNDRNALKAMADRLDAECRPEKRPDDELVTYQLRPATLLLVMNAALAYKTYDCAGELGKLAAHLSENNVRHNRKPEPPRELPPIEDVLAAEREGLRSPVESEVGDYVRTAT